MKVLLIDNYDSFTFNLYQYLGELLIERFANSQLDVKRNDEITLAEIRAKDYDRIVISPGPGNPADTAYFNVCKDVILDLAQMIPTLGICLGLQGIAHYYGGKVIRAATPVHGKISSITHGGQGLFTGVSDTISAMRYHSLVVEPESVPACLEITARVKTAPDGSGGEIMGLRHRQYLLEGVQFHPESFATSCGKQVLTNFLEHTYESSNS